MPSTAFVIPLRSTFPSPALNPLLNKSCSSFSFVIILSNTGFTDSSTASAASVALSATPVSAPPPDDPLPLESFFVNEWISSKDPRPSYAFAAFVADVPAASVAVSNESTESVAESTDDAIALDDEELSAFFPVNFAIRLENASATV